MTDASASGGRSASSDAATGPPGDDVLALVAVLAGRLSKREVDFSRGLSGLLSGIQGLDGDPFMVELLQASVAANVNTILHLLTNNIPIEHLQPTTAAVEFAIRLAQRGVPADALIRAYHMGQDQFLGELFVEAEAVDAPAEQRLAAIRHASRVLYRYIDWITVFLVERYEEERNRWAVTVGNLYSSLLHQIVAGGESDLRRFRAETGYDLDQHHVAMMAWTTVESPTTDDLHQLERFIRTLASRLDTPAGPIFTAVDRSLAWAWYPRGREGAPVDTAVVAEAAATTPFRLSIGLPGAGIRGFRRSHQQAEEARQVALANPAAATPALGFGDHGIAIVAALARSPEATGAWVTSVLGGLAERGESVERLRETVLTYLASGASQAETATALNLHRNSVRYRLERAEEVRGRPLTEDRLGLEVALLALHHLGPTIV